ncbi:hypothetical protein AMTRI_Chr12g269210 [Amborella trichopoda]
MDEYASQRGSTQNGDSRNGSLLLSRHLNFIGKSSQHSNHLCHNSRISSTVRENNAYEQPQSSKPSCHSIKFEVGSSSKQPYNPSFQSAHHWQGSPSFASTSSHRSGLIVIPELMNSDSLACVSIGNSLTAKKSSMSSSLEANEAFPGFLCSARELSSNGFGAEGAYASSNSDHFTPLLSTKTRDQIHSKIGNIQSSNNRQGLLVSGNGSLNSEDISLGYNSREKSNGKLLAGCGLGGFGCVSMSDAVSSACPSSTMQGHLGHAKQADKMKQPVNAHDSGGLRRITRAAKVGDSASTSRSRRTRTPYSNHDHLLHGYDISLNEPSQPNGIRRRNSNGQLVESSNCMSNSRSVNSMENSSHLDGERDSESLAANVANPRLLIGQSNESIGDSLTFPLLDPVSHPQQSPAPFPSTTEHNLSRDTEPSACGRSSRLAHRNGRRTRRNFSHRNNPRSFSLEGITEELLALEERIGSVNTGLDEKALAKCLKRSYYSTNTSYCKSPKDDNAKCSICLEDYADADEFGKLECNHGYHSACIQQWLSQKNWCPICKLPAING